MKVPEGKERIALDVLEACLKRPDLVQQQFRDGDHPLRGFCYIAHEAIWHLDEEIQERFTPSYTKLNDETHWFLRGGGEIFDITEDQYEEVDHSSVAGGGFLTGEPSERARKLIGEIDGRDDS